MNDSQKAREAGFEESLERRVSCLRRIAILAKKHRKTPLGVCKAVIGGRVLHPDATEFFRELPENDRHYWIASLYTLLMPEERRRSLAAYFTPPHLAEHAISGLVRQGLKLGSDRILDPASGGAAFLVPLAATIANSSRRQGESAKELLEKINSTIAGIEIEPSLARLSELLLEDILRPELTTTGHKLKVPITRANTLKLKPQPIFDAVIANPPYGRIFRPRKQILAQFSEVITDSYVNLYALFIKQALGWTRPDGLICLIIPMSFLGGAYFAALRKFILDNTWIIGLDPIEQRSDLFLDVLCDVCVLTLRKKGSMIRTEKPTSWLLRFQKPRLNLGLLDVPKEPSGRIWALPNSAHAEEFFANTYESLESYGYTIKSGYFVWNREKKRYRKGLKPKPNEVPLYWAHNIKANGTCKPLAAEPSARNPFGFVDIDSDSAAIIHTDAILIQRTSNSRQKRRLIAAVVSKTKVLGSRGFVTENHTLVVIPSLNKTQQLPMKILCRLLNSDAVDSRFRRISGTVSVSVSALRALPLPMAEYVLQAFSTAHDDDTAAKMAYANTHVAQKQSNMITPQRRNPNER